MKIKDTLPPLSALFSSFFPFSISVVYGSTSVEHVESLDDQVERVAGYLNGVMDSSLQAIENPSFLDVTVQHCPVRVVDGDSGAALQNGKYLLLMQSISSSEAPYRVRVVHLHADGTQQAVASSDYLIAQNIDTAGMCRKSEFERVFKSSQLILNKCTTYLRKTGDHFEGGTLPEGCSSDHQGAVRLTNIVTLGHNAMTSWDRGWKADGTQAWGAVLGPYEFRRVGEGKQDPMLAQLASFMTGKLSNKIQVEKDASSYVPVDYHICQIDGAQKLGPNVRLLLSKQTIKTPANTVERARIYRLERSTDQQIKVTANTFDDKKISSSLCNETLTKRLELDLSAIQWDASCPVMFSYDDKLKSYTGSTPKDGCPSSYQGSVKFMSDEVISEGVIAPWERWLDAQGNIVAGSKKGAYIYIRQ